MNTYVVQHLSNNKYCTYCTVENKSLHSLGCEGEGRGKMTDGRTDIFVPLCHIRIIKDEYCNVPAQTVLSTAAIP